MLSFMQNVYNASYPAGYPGCVNDSGSEESSFFGNIFLPVFDAPSDSMFDDYLPEFDLEGMKEPASFSPSETVTCLSRCKSNPALSSTQDCEDHAGDSDKLSDVGSETVNCKALSTTSAHFESNLSKRQPCLPEAPSRITQFAQVAIPEDFEHQQVVRSLLVSQICKMIDRESLSETDVLSLDAESLQLLTNFSFMIYKVTISNGAQLPKSISELNKVIQTGAEKKKRNEERIKYVFKRVNKLLLKRFMKKEGLNEESENLAMRQIICLYFSKGSQYDKIESMPGYDRYFTLLFKPSNMYRNDLKDVFSYPSYASVFKQILEEEFLVEYQNKRTSKIESYLKTLKNEIFYSPDQTDPSILNHKLSRLPWSMAEVQKGASLLSSVLNC